LECFVSRDRGKLSSEVQVRPDRMQVMLAPAVEFAYRLWISLFAGSWAAALWTKQPQCTALLNGAILKQRINSALSSGY